MKGLFGGGGLASKLKSVVDKANEKPVASPPTSIASGGGPLVESGGGVRKQQGTTVKPSKETAPKEADKTPNSTSETMEWLPVASGSSTAPTPRHGHSMSFVNDAVYIIGGIDHGVRVNTVMELKLATMRWTRCVSKGDVPTPRAYHSSWTQGDYIYIYGGEGPGNAESMEHHEHVKVLLAESTRKIKRICYDDVIAFNTKLSTWIKCNTMLPPLARKGHTTVIVGSTTVVMFGGAPSNAGTPTNDLYALKCEGLATNRGTAPAWWKPKVEGTPPSARYDHTCNKLNDTTLAIFGGSRGGGHLYSDLFLLHIDCKDDDSLSMRWSFPLARGKCPPPIYGHCSSPLFVEGSGSKLVVFGGITNSGGRYSFSKETYVLDADTMNWSQVEVGYSYPQPRYGHSMVSIPKTRSVAIAGVENDAVPRKKEKKTNTFLVYGGLNTMYCAGDVWLLKPTVFANPSMDFKKMAENVLISKDIDFESCGGILRSSEMEKVEALIMDTKKEKIEAEERIASEISKRTMAVSVLEAENESLKQQLEAIREEFSKYKISNMKKAKSSDAISKKYKAYAADLSRQLQEANRVIQLMDIGVKFRLAVNDELHTANKSLDGTAGGYKNPQN